MPTLHYTNRYHNNRRPKTKALVKASIWTFPSLRANKCGSIGLLLSAIPLLTIFWLSFLPFNLVGFAKCSSFLGAVVSLVGLFRRLRSYAVLGLLLAGIVWFLLRY